MNATLSEPHPWKRVFDIEVPVDEVHKAVEERIASYQRKMTLPGFRKGKVPAELIRNRFGKDIRGEAIENLIQKSFEDACKEKGVSPINRGTVSGVSADEGMPLKFKVETEVEPALDIKGYQKLKVRPSPNKVRPAEVDKIVQDLRERHATFTDVERAIRKGDFVTFQYERVEIDGAERKDISSPTYPVEAGASEIKGFDKAIIGAAAGQSVDAEIAFPRDYADKEIAGKKGMLKLKVVKVQERHVPELNEELIKKIGGDLRDEAHLREVITKDLEERETARARGEAAGKAVEALIKSNPFELPPSLVERYIDAVHEDIKGRAKEGEPAPTREEVAGRYRDYGIHMMKRQRILDFIATRENIKASQADVDRQIETIAGQYGQPVDKVKEALRRNGTTMRIRDDIRERKTLDYLIGEYDPAAEQAAAPPAAPAAPAEAPAQQQ